LVTLVGRIKVHRCEPPVVGWRYSLKRKNFGFVGGREDFVFVGASLIARGVKRFNRFCVRHGSVGNTEQSNLSAQQSIFIPLPALKGGCAWSLPLVEFSFISAIGVRGGREVRY